MATLRLHRRMRVFLYWTCLALSLIPGYRAEAQPASLSLCGSEHGSRPLKWYLSIGASNAHPKLSGIQSQIERGIDTTFRQIAPGFDDVRTFSDMRNNFRIWLPSIRLGRILSPRWSLFVHAGYIEHSIRNENEDMSIAIRPLHTDVKLHVSHFSAGGGAAYYPWGMPELRQYDSLLDRLKHARPFIETSIKWVRVKSYAEVKFGLKPWDNAYKVRREFSWSPWAVKLAGGVQVPLTGRTSLSLDMNYQWFSSQGNDLDGPAIGLAWQWHF